MTPSQHANGPCVGLSAAYKSHNTRLCDADTARQLPCAGSCSKQEEGMDWTKTRLNVQYQWRTILLWIIGIGLVVAFIM